MVLVPIKNIYGSKNTEKDFWRELLIAFYVMGCRRSNIDPCMYFKWTEMGLLVWLSWIDNCACFGRYDEVENTRKNDEFI